MTHKRMFAVGLGGGYIKLVLAHKPPEAIKTSTTKDVTVEGYGYFDLPGGYRSYGHHELKKKLNIKTIYWKGGRSLGVYNADGVSRFLIDVACQSVMTAWQFLNITKGVCWEVPHEVALLLNQPARARLRREL